MNDREPATSGPSPTYRVMGYPVHHESEQIVLSMLSTCNTKPVRRILSRLSNLPSRVLDSIESEQPDTVLLVVMPPGGVASS